MDEPAQCIDARCSIKNPLWIALNDTGVKPSSHCCKQYICSSTLHGRRNILKDEFTLIPFRGQQETRVEFLWQGSPRMRYVNSFKGVNKRMCIFVSHVKVHQKTPTKEEILSNHINRLISHMHFNQLHFLNYPQCKSSALMIDGRDDDHG